MAYKIAIGNQSLGGSIITPGDILAENQAGTRQDVTASNLVASDDIIVAGTATITNNNITAVDEAALYAGTTTASDDKLIVLDTDSNAGRVQIYGQAAGSTNGIDLEIDCDSGDGRLKVGNNNVFGTTFAASNGSWSGKQFEIGGNLNVGGNLSLTDCNLKVAGSTTTLDVNDFQVSDEILVLASASSGTPATNNAGFIFGKNNFATSVSAEGANSATAGGLGFLYKDATDRFEVLQSKNSEAFYDVKANKFFGDASGLTALPAGKSISKRFEFSTQSGNDVNLTATAAGKVIRLTHNGAITCTLPAGSTMVPGQTLKIKAPSTCSTSQKVTIDTAGSEVIGCDTNGNGSADIKLQNPNAAVELLFLGSVQTGGQTKVRYVIM